MIDIKKVRERLKSKYTGYGNDEMLLCYTEEQRNIVEEALTELERLQKFKATFDAYELSQKQGFIAYENWQECEKELKTYKGEVEELMTLVIGNYDMARLEEDMKGLEGKDLRIAQLIIKLSRGDE